MPTFSSPSWLTGKPVRSRPLIWPSNDKTINAGIWDRQGTSLLNGMVLHWFAFKRDSDTGRSTIYLANVRVQAQGTDVVESDGQDPVVLTPIAKELDYAADRVALIGSNVFVTAEWIASNHTLKLRLHSLEGALIREISVSVQAAYGDLHVFGHNVSISISSGPMNAPERALTPDYLRLGSDVDNADAEPLTELFADQILEWDTTSGLLRRVQVPSSIRHAAEYSFLEEHRVVLAGLVDAQVAQEQLALTYFKVDDLLVDQSSLSSFSPGGSSQDRIMKGMGIGTEGSTERSEIIVHSFDRIAVFSRSFLSRKIPDNPRTGNFHYLKPLLLDYDVRVLPFALPGSLPSVSNNRVLVYRKVLGKFQFQMLDFDQKRVQALLDKNAEEREALRAELADANARVKVVTRQYYAQEEGVGGGSVDVEYPIRRVPSEWTEHLKEVEEQEKEGLPLIFDEAPEGRRPGRFGFVQTQLRLGREISWISVGRMGVTDEGVVLSPEPGDSGSVWYFE